jgi:hypothetical protein
MGWDDNDGPTITIPATLLAQGKVMHVWIQGIQGKSMNLPLNFAVNLKKIPSPQKHWIHVFKLKQLTEAQHGGKLPLSLQ